MNTETNKKLNYTELVPKLISNSLGLSIEVRNRLKSNHLFNEFEIKASNQFNFFIKESEKRHLGSKYGAKIDYLLKSSRRRGQKEAYKILHDKFYLDKELIKERKKMLKKSTYEFHENIMDTINKIKGIKNNQNYWNENSNKNKMKKPKKKIRPLNDEIMMLKNKKILDLKKNELNKIFHKEEEKLKTFFNKYKTYLSQMNNSSVAKTENNESSTNNIRNKTFNKKLIFTFPKMQLLNYTKSLTNMKTKKEIDEENRINLNKLLKYSLSKKEIESYKNNNKYHLTNPNKKDGFYFEMKNTNNLVLHKALNEYNSFKNKFLKKNEALRDKLGIDKIPNLKEYENLIKNNFNKIKQKRRYLNDIIYAKQKELGKNRKELLIEKIDENLDFLKDFENNLMKKNKILKTRKYLLLFN